METFKAVCLGLITLELTLVTVALLITLIKVRQAALAVEIAAYRVDQQVENFGATLNGGLFQGVKTVLRLAGRLWNKG